MLFSKRPMATFQELYQIILDHDVITIWGHTLPDGDCYGSQIALKNLILDTFPEKKVFACGSGLPSFFDRLGAMDHPSEEELKASLAILVDVSCLNRVELQEVRMCKDFIKFDHHCLNPGNEPFPWPNFVDHERIAATEIIADFAIENNLKFSKISAEAIYLGMATDSGKFIYHGTTKHTFEIISFLQKQGANLKEVLDIAYYERKEVRQYKAYMKRHVHCRGNVDYCVMHPEDYNRFGVTYEEAGSYANVVAGRHRKPIYMLATEDCQGNYRIELRSNKCYPVHGTAVQFGGGGHRYAAGCNIIDGKPTLDEIIDSLNLVKQEEVIS